MALFTKLSEADAATVCEHFDLGEVSSCEGVPTGTINSNYRVRTSKGIWFVRINEGKTLADVSYESELVAHLARHGVRTPEPMSGPDGRGFAELDCGLVSVFAWIPGQHLCAQRLTSQALHAVGEQLARAHQAGASFARRKESRYEPRAVKQRFDALCAGHGSGELAADLEELGKAFAHLDEVRYTSSYGEAPLPSGVIHSDLFPDNVLFDGPVVTALLDFEQAADGRFVFDLAVALVAWTYDESASDFVTDHARALVRGYQSLRPLEPRERLHLGDELLMAATRFAVTRLTDVHLRTGVADEVRLAKDYRHYVSRTRHISTLPSTFPTAWY